jgi:phosphoribosyl 1,2-cyclic phosphodiesterase
MSLYITSLNSGSNGNCYYIGNQDQAVLIDAGLSCRETEKRMKRLGLPMSTVKALFVSHEHTDHITGIPTLSKKYQLPVYITGATLDNSNIPIEKHLIISFQPGKPVSIGGLVVTAFRKSHDASDPHSFMVTGNEINIGIFTDIGYPGKELIRYFKQCHAAFLEANYCEDMLENGGYPRYLKKRISGRRGHLSNTQALELFNKHKPKHLSHLILSHLSENNNNPKLVEKLFNQQAGTTKIIVASRYEETALYCIERSLIVARSGVARKSQHNQKQLSLF